MRRRRRHAVSVALTIMLAAAFVIARAWRGAMPEFAPARGTVRRVVDGDTFCLTNGARVRLLEIDAPERDGPSADIARRATRALRELVQGRVVRLEPGPRARDRYGRFLCYVFVRAGNRDAQDARDVQDARDGEREIMVDAELARLGLARARTWGPPGPHFDEVLAAENEAKAAGRGMWARGEAAGK